MLFSAGIGRTGTFIVIDILIDIIREKGEFALPFLHPSFQVFPDLISDLSVMVCSGAQIGLLSVFRLHTSSILARQPDSVLLRERGKKITKHKERE